MHSETSRELTSDPESLQHLGLFSKIGRAGKRQKGTDADAQNAGQPTKAIESLEEIAKGAHVDCRDLETALIKLHNAHHRGYGKCAGGLECSGVEGGGAHGETKKEEVGSSPFVARSVCRRRALR